MLKTFVAVILTGSFALAAGDAGCGLGSLIISKNSKLLQLLAMTTNSWFFTQPLGITSGTSGCNANGIVKSEKQIQYFVEVNQDDLTREMAQGHGDKLSTLAALNGCTTEDQISAFNAKAQSSFKSIVPSAQISATDFVSNLKASAVADACQQGA